MVGFSLVIAREIRRLADQTASATDRADDYRAQMQAAVSRGCHGNGPRGPTTRRTRCSPPVLLMMTEIIDRVNRSTDSFQRVNESMQRSRRAKQISEAMGSLVKATPTR